VGKFPVNITEDIVRQGSTLFIDSRDADRLYRSTLEYSRVAVVCSARSSYTKLDGTTNR
jgi:hypothetical protein